MSAARKASAAAGPAPRLGSYSEAGYLLAKVHQISGRVFARLLKDAGGDEINPAQGRILFALWKAEGLSAGELSRETALEPSTLTSMIDRLESAGLVKRSPSPADRRALVISCTPAGRAIEARYSAVSGRMVELYYRGIDAAERKAFEAKLRRILANLQEAERG